MANRAALVLVLVPVVFVAATLLPVGIEGSPAGAVAADISCATYNYTETLSPGLPVTGNPATVTPTITSTVTFSGCVGLGITGGTASFTGGTTKPVNCASLNPGITVVGTSTITWSTGQTSTVSNGFPIVYGAQITSGLFSGAEITPPPGVVTNNPGACSTTPLTNFFQSGSHLTLFLPEGAAKCASPQACDTTRSASATLTAPGLTVRVTGTPAVGAGTVQLGIASGKLACPGVAATITPVARFTDTGFAPTDRLNVAGTLPATSATNAEQVCFHSTVPFRSQSSPTVAKAGTAFLLNCVQVANVAPCVISSTQVGTDVVVKFVVPGGDPEFCIKLKNGRQAWLLQHGIGRVGRPYAANLNTSGGIAPFTWSIASGRLPDGCVLNRRTGAITGKPKKKGSYPLVAKATDSERPARTATVTLKIRIT